MENLKYFNLDTMKKVTTYNEDGYPNGTTDKVINSKTISYPEAIYFLIKTYTKLTTDETTETFLAKNSSSKYLFEVLEKLQELSTMDEFDEPIKVPSTDKDSNLFYEIDFHEEQRLTYFEE